MQFFILKKCARVSFFSQPPFVLPLVQSYGTSIKKPMKNEDYGNSWFISGTAPH